MRELIEVNRVVRELWEHDCPEFAQSSLFKKLVNTFQNDKGGELKIWLPVAYKLYKLEKEERKNPTIFFMGVDSVISMTVKLQIATGHKEAVREIYDEIKSMLSRSATNPSSQ